MDAITAKPKLTARQEEILGLSSGLRHFVDDNWEFVLSHRHDWNNICRCESETCLSQLDKTYFKKKEVTN
jgi:hypothetical protein